MILWIKKIIYSDDIVGALGIFLFLAMGIGVVEGILTGFFPVHGIDLSVAIRVVIVIRLFTRWYSVSFGFIALKLSGGLTNNQEPNNQEPTNSKR